MSFYKRLDLDPLFGLATDTLWGLACKANDLESVSKIFNLKQRDGRKPLILFAQDIRQAQDLIHISQPVQTLLEKWWPGLFRL